MDYQPFINPSMTVASTAIMRRTDILSTVIQHLTDCRDDLLSLALTSQLVSSIALDYLWKDLPTTQYILCLLPGFDVIDEIYVRRF